MKHLFAFTLTCLIVFNGFSQQNLWTKVTKPVFSNTSAQITQTTSTLYFDFAIQAFKSKYLSEDEFDIWLPIENEKFVQFHLKVNQLMPIELREKYATIRAYDGVATDFSNKTAKVEIGPDYFRAMISIPGKESIFIDPVVYTRKEQTHYVVYRRSQLVNNTDFECHFVNNSIQGTNEFFASKAIQTCEMRTYRLAVAATGEYTVFQGGTIEQTLAAQVTTINRVNSVYERDLAITLVMIPNNDTLIYLDATSDPYSNGDTGAMIEENITNVNDVIGLANFDVGHVFGTDSGGLAYLNAVCNDEYKAGGVTGSSAPTGDAFDIDYVCHEVGHEFGGNHSFNNACGGNRNNGTAYETGSGSTIMGYAGVCDPNVQAHSDDYFHAISLQEIGIAVSASSHTCAVKTPLNNSAPQVTLAESITIPSGTPFVLKGVAIDTENDSITYCWEQMDREISTQPPVTTSIKGPNFRSFNPTTSPLRFVPSIANQLNPSYKWEVLSEGERTYKFRLTVRDNAVGGGCTDSKDITVNADPNSGPFVITYPTASGIVWTGLTTETVTWDVANTDQTPIQCQNVKISISHDQGATFTTLLESTPNTGTAQITVPNVNSSFNLILIESADGTFFTLSKKFFKIKMGTATTTEIVSSKPELTLFPNPATSSMQIQFTGIEQLKGYVIYNSLGQIVLSSNQAISNDTKVSLKSLSSGVYFFQTLIGNTKVIKKLIKS